MNLQNDIIMKFLDECFDAGIKQPEAFILSKMPQVYGWLKGAFGPKILPTDIDGEVEINGHFLRLEFKHECAMRNARIPVGQYRSLKALIPTGRFSILLIGTSDKGEPTCFEVWHHNGTISKLKDGGRDEIFNLCKRWAEYARKTP